MAENLLQQIDQQAAGSLGKGDRTQSEELKLETPSKSSGSVPLKDQLRKKTPEVYSDLIAKSKSDYSPNYYTARKSFSSDSSGNKNNSQEKESSKTDSKSVILTDNDWTELLSTPKPSSSIKSNRPKKASGVTGVKKDGRKVGNLDWNVKGSNKVGSSLPRAGDGMGGKRNGQLGEDPRISDSTPRGSSVASDDKSSGEREVAHDPAMVDNAVGGKDSGEARNSSHNLSGKRKDLVSGKQPTEATLGNMDEKPPHGSNVRVVENPHKKNDEEEINSKITRSSPGRLDKAPGDLKQASYLESDEESISDSESGSTTDSETEQEREKQRKRRQQILAAKAAAKAADAVKDRENLVAKLEGEKQSLEKIIEERAKQAVLEASELQSTMMETMEAVELEKQKHNNTRMEILARLAKLETANAELAKSLAITQRDLEVKINRVGELRQQIESKEIVHEELRRRISSTHQSGTSHTNLLVSRGIELEMLDTECSFVIDKVGRLQEKAKKLEADIQLAQKEMEKPTEVEVELKQRLGQMTDHLIQKQAQVEALSSEKATLAFRIEAVSKLLDENKLMNGVDSSGILKEDLEAGRWELSRSKLRPMFEEKIRSGKQHFGSLVLQLDALFSAGVVFLRRNPTAKIWALVYVVCLHLWVLYILFSHSQSADVTKSGAVVSLENINNTVRV